MLLAMLLYEGMVTAFHLLNLPSNLAVLGGYAYELAKTQAEAAKTVAGAEGEEKAAVTRAQGEAEANRIRQTSLTPQLPELRKIEIRKS